MGKGIIYVIESKNGLVKVGSSSRPIQRKTEIENMSGFEILKFFNTEICDNPTFVEHQAHKALYCYRKCGEWFSCSYETAIDAVNNSFSDNAIFDSPENHFDGEAFEKEMLRLYGFKIINSCEVSAETAIEKLSQFNVSLFSIRDFTSEIESYEELDEFDLIEKRKKEYPHMSNGIEDREELEKYALEMYYTLLYSSFSDFSG